MTAHKQVATVTVDVVLFTIRQGRLSVLLVARDDEPFQGCWALPGGPPVEAADLDQSAHDHLERGAGAAVSPGHLEQLRTYGAPDRDPSTRQISVAYLGFMPDLPAPVAVGDRPSARFWPIDDFLTGDDAPDLVLDHRRIIGDGLERARAKLEYTTLATTFLEEPFTISDLRRVYQTVWGVRLEPANFRRKVVERTDGFVEPTGESRPTGRAPALLYRSGPATELTPPLVRPEADEDD
ncbi:MAG: NUDIX hydrolase [Acidimicrobiia bacterium]|nr:NUDIX hydrolase [Acidimicrobiia bacterium]MDH4353692.1 NUDIX hydrolase [Actinomycetota bacterium]